MKLVILTIDVSPRDSQDDKIIPEHIKINPKYSFICIKSE